MGLLKDLEKANSEKNKILNKINIAVKKIGKAFVYYHKVKANQFIYDGFGTRVRIYYDPPKVGFDEPWEVVGVMTIPTWAFDDTFKYISMINQGEIPLNLKDY